MPDTRPVWLTREQRDWLERTLEVTERVPGAPRQTPARSILRAWDAAPADAAEAVRVALTTPGEVYPDLVLGPILADALAPEVLHALGQPEAR